MSLNFPRLESCPFSARCARTIANVASIASKLPCRFPRARIGTGSAACRPRTRRAPRPAPAREEASLARAGAPSCPTRCRRISASLSPPARPGRGPGAPEPSPACRLRDRYGVGLAWNEGRDGPPQMSVAERDRCQDRDFVDDLLAPAREIAGVDGAAKRPFALEDLDRSPACVVDLSDVQLPVGPEREVDDRGEAVEHNRALWALSAPGTLGVRVDRQIRDAPVGAGKPLSSPM